MFASELQIMVDEMLHYHCPRYYELPEVALYRDQVLDELNRHILPLCADRSEPPVTAAMINNYVKLKLIDPPVKKKYDRSQVAHLYVILLLKQVFSISEIRDLLSIQARTYPTFSIAYDFFCTEFEWALKASFQTRDFSGPSSASRHTPQSELTRGMALCLAQKIFSQKYLKMDAIDPIAPITLADYAPQHIKTQESV